MLNLFKVKSVAKEEIPKLLKLLWRGRPRDTNFHAQLLSLASSKFTQLLSFDFRTSHGEVNCEDGLQFHELLPAGPQQPLKTLAEVFLLVKLLVSFYSYAFGDLFNIVLTNLILPLERFGGDYSVPTINDVFVMAFQRLGSMQVLSPPGYHGVLAHLKGWLVLHNYDDPRSAVHTMLADTHRSYSLREAKALSAKIDANSAQMKRQLEEHHAKNANPRPKPPAAPSPGPADLVPVKRRKGAEGDKGKQDLSRLEGFCISTFSGHACKKLAAGKCMYGKPPTPLKHAEEFAALPKEHKQKLRKAYKDIEAAWKVAES